MKRVFRDGCQWRIVFLLVAALKFGLAGGPVVELKTSRAVLGHDAWQKQVLEDFDFQTWKGVSREAYARRLSALDLSEFRFPKVKVAVGVVVSTNKYEAGQSFGVVAENPRRMLARIDVLAVQDILSAQQSMMRMFSEIPVRVPRIEKIEIGDRGYAWGDELLQHVAFTRNNVRVKIFTDCTCYSAGEIARQIDELILKQSRAPEKKWWDFFSR